MTIVPRTEWVTSQWPFTGPRSDLDNVDEIIIHYPGVPAGALNLNDPVKVMRDTHSYYMRRHPTGYAFGYGWGVFPTGIYEGRGFDIRNAANAGHNDHTLSINVMVNGQDGATASQVRYTRELVELIWQRLGRRVPLIAHGDLSGAATQCPGRGIRAQIGAFYPLAQPEKPTDPQQPQRHDQLQEEPVTTLYRIDGKLAVWQSDRTTRVHVPTAEKLGYLESKYGKTLVLAASTNIEDLGEQIISETPNI